MTSITVTCDGCAGTGDATHEDRHTGTNMDRCRKCGGEGKIPARTGETPEASFQPLPEAAAPVDLGQVAYEERWEGFTVVPAWANLPEEGKQVWRRVALAARNAPWPPATPGRIMLQVDQGVEGLWYVTSPAPAGLLVAGETMRGALDQVEKALEDMKRATAEVGGDAILVDEAVAKEALGVAKTIEAARPLVVTTDTVALHDLAHVLAAHMEEGQITLAGIDLVSVALDRVFPKLLHTRERCEVAECLVHGGCEECPTEAQVDAADAKLTAWLRDNPPSDAVPVEARSLKAACEPWHFGLGGPPDKGSPLYAVFSAGAIYAIRDLGMLTNSTGWWLQHGHGDFESVTRASLIDVLKHAGLYDPDTGRLATLTSVNDQGRTQVEEGLTAQIRALEASQRMDGLTAAEWQERWTEQGNTLAARIRELAVHIGSLEEQIRKSALAAFNEKVGLEGEVEALRLLLRRNEVRVGRQRELLQENNKLLDRARAAEASSAKLRAALRHLFPFVDRAVGEGIVFGPDGKAPAMDALEVYAAAGCALGFEAVDDPTLMALSAPGDTPPAAATVPALYLNYRGDLAVRHIVPIRFWEGESEWHPGERHFLRVVEPETKKVRDFALSGIIAWGQAAIDRAESLDRSFQYVRQDLAAERDAKACGEIEVTRRGLDLASPDMLGVRVCVSRQEVISGGPEILDRILERAKADLTVLAQQVTVHSESRADANEHATQVPDGSWALTLAAK
ncbi:hypothetical protein [Methylobacterium platani]|uniref:Uncharacterized protein n=2 Tax=Methylobacterium platani TaxID=427683 RepID=A0A179SEP1_9HYPH|nr:hypothetical protein [Methylobacterium platani]OAS26337.1 hypothetical protein A5481_06375 [Methylobacterium platani]